MEMLLVFAFLWRRNNRIKQSEPEIFIRLANLFR